MIDIKELRIGNYVSTDGDPMYTHRGGMYKVNSIDILDEFDKSIGNAVIETDHEIYNSCTAWSRHLEPIKLTPDILKSCGFIYSSNHVYERKDYNILFDEPDDWNKTDKYPIGIFGGYTSLFGYAPHGEVIIRCLYLHTLQNMFHAITQKELKCNFKVK